MRQSDESSKIAACRQPETFTSVARDILRVDISLLSKRVEPEDDHRLLVKSLPGKAPAPPLQDVSKSAISDLVQSDPEEPAESEQQGDVAGKSEEMVELPTSVASILNVAPWGARGVAQGALQWSGRSAQNLYQEGRERRW